MLRNLNLTFILLVFGIMDMYAQGIGNDEMFTASRDESLSQEKAMNGLGGIIISSEFSDLIVKVTSGNAAADAYPVGTGKNGDHLYIVPINVDKSRIGHFIVQRKGHPERAEFSERSLGANRLVGYRLIMPKNPIRLSTQPTSAIHPSQTEALVEISTAFNDVSIKTPTAVPFIIEKGKQENDASINVFRVIVPIAKIKEFKENVKEKQKAYDEFFQNAIAKTGLLEGADRDKEEQLLKELENLEKAEAELDYIYVTRPESNVLQMQISNLNIKEKRLVAIVPVIQTEIKEVYKNPFDEYMAQAQDAYDTRKYGTALGLYKQAAEADGITNNQRSLALERAAIMEELSEFMQNVKNCAATWKRLQASGTVKRHVAEECLEFAITNLSTLYDRTNNPFFENLRDKYEQRLRNFPVVIAGTIRVKDYYGGVMEETPLRNCEIYGAVSRKDLVGEKIGEVNSDGTFSVQFPRGQYYRLFFKPYSGSPMTHVRELKLLRDGNASMNINQDFKP